ncbi:olfactory receptor 2AE1-like [Erinaceus europaeus]|uniref:Olfactory receptor 2AE1-like n=1 Tax=Erinaceus europaeus TaxID=9365 RepID=A0A1S3AQU7_ERIEU|nr:olfactory receptor 2AE1-like [Erinaceus europaeus]
MWQRNETSLADFILEGLFDDSLAHVFLFSLTMVVFLVGVSGNSLTILLICADPRLHTPMYFLLSQLSFMDLMFVSTTVPKMAANYLSGRKSISFVGCAIQHFLYLLLGSAECALLALMSYDRYVAICNPLRYTVLMNRNVTLMMAAIAWLGGFTNSIIHTMILMHYPFCGSRKISHFYCEFPAVVKLVCGDITVYEKTVYISSILLLLLPILLVSASYAFILHSVIHMRSAGSKRNAFATCSSHLTVVFLWFGACIFSYMRPRSQHTPLKDKVGSLFYSIITPTLNPLIYTLRNKDVARAIKKALFDLSLASPHLSYCAAVLVASLMLLEQTLVFMDISESSIGKRTMIAVYDSIHDIQYRGNFGVRTRNLISTLGRASLENGFTLSQCGASPPSSSFYTCSADSSLQRRSQSCSDSGPGVRVPSLTKESLSSYKRTIPPIPEAAKTDGLQSALAEQELMVWVSVAL